jgi:hypothetical protein
MSVGTGQNGGMEQTGGPIIVCETGLPMNLLRTIDPGYAGSDTPIAHLLIGHFQIWLLMLRLLLFCLLLYWLLLF